jgi:hypothetical protein
VIYIVCTLSFYALILSALAAIVCFVIFYGVFEQLAVAMKYIGIFWQLACLSYFMLAIALRLLRGVPMVCPALWQACVALGTPWLVGLLIYIAPTVLGKFI